MTIAALDSFASSTLASIPVSMALGPSDAIVFDGYSLQDAPRIITSRIDYDDSGDQDIDAVNYPRAHGGTVLSRFYRGRVITLESCVYGTDSADLDGRIDELKRRVSGVEGNLDIRVGGVVRRIRATLQSGGMRFNRQHYHVTFVKVVMQFRALEPFFYELGEQTASGHMGNSGTWGYDLIALSSLDGWLSLFNQAYEYSNGGRGDHPEYFGWYWPGSNPHEYIESDGGTVERFITWKIPNAAGSTVHEFVLSVTAYDPLLRAMKAQWSDDNATWNDLAFSGNALNSTTWTVSPGSTQVYIRILKQSGTDAVLNVARFSVTWTSSAAMYFDFSGRGSAPTEPKILLAFTSGTDASEVRLNTSRGSLTLTHALVSGDVVVFDAVAKEVVVNGESVDYSGVFPIFPAEGETFSVQATGEMHADAYVFAKVNFL